jgi:hypothetical protein
MQSFVESYLFGRELARFGLVRCAFVGRQWRFELSWLTIGLLGEPSQQQRQSVPDVHTTDMTSYDSMTCIQTR